MTNAQKFEALLAKQIKKNMEKRPTEYAPGMTPAFMAKKLTECLVAGQAVSSDSAGQVTRSLKIKGGFAGVVAYLRDTTDYSEDIASAVPKVGQA